MNFKIVETGSEYTDVLLYLDKDFDEETDGDKFWVTIMAWGMPTGDDCDMQAFETVDFSSIESARSFIRDYSEKSAVAWCKKEGMVYPQ